MEESLRQQLAATGLTGEVPPSTAEWRVLLEKLNGICASCDARAARDATIHRRLATELAQAQGELTQQHAQLETFFQVMDDGLCTMTAAGEVLVANEPALRLLGLVQGPPPYPHILDAFQAMDSMGQRQSLGPKLRELIQKGERWRCEDAWLVTEAAQGYSVSMSLAPFATTSEDGTRAVLTIRDTSLLRQAQEAARAGESRFRGIFEGTAVGLAILWFDGAIAVTNPALQQLIGQNDAELSQRNFIELLAPECAQPAQEQIAQAAREAAPTAPLVVSFVAPNDERRPARITTTSVSDTTGSPQFLIVSVLDESKTHQLEVELRHSQKLEAVGRLAAGIAHEINTPIQFIGDNAHFLKTALGMLTALVEDYRRIVAEEGLNQLFESFDKADRKRRRTYVESEIPTAVEQTLEGVERVRKIVEGLKTFAHPGSRKLVSADLNQNLEATLNVARNEYKYVADLVLELGELPMVSCVAGDLNQVFLNLVVNAAHAMRDKESATGQRGILRVKTSASSSTVRVEISDTGTGIPSAVQNRLFEPFFTTKEVGKGTGQGLALSRAVVERHGGRIWFETRPGEGTTFLVELPITPPPMTNPGPESRR